MKASLWFVTPAFQRFELSRICFEQRADAIEKLRDAGIDANCVVVADDGNLTIAEEFGFATVARDNQWLGRRFNDGYEYAAKNGATHVFPIGSDSWCDPQFIIDAFDGGLHKDAVISSRHYTRINDLGTRRKQLWVPIWQGVSYVIPVRLIEPLNFRPCQDEIKSGCDGSTWVSVTRANGGEVEVVWSESHLFDTVAFESWPQISNFEKLGQRWAVSQDSTPFADLDKYYDPSLVERIVRFYDERRDTFRMMEERKNLIDVRVNEIVNAVVNGEPVPSQFRHLARGLINKAVRMALES